jgi:hypothetical protein
VSPGIRLLHGVWGTIRSGWYAIRVRRRLWWWAQFAFGAVIPLITAIINAFARDWIAVLTYLVMAWLFVWTGVMARLWFRIGYMRGATSNLSMEQEFRLMLDLDPTPEPWEREPWHR